MRGINKFFALDLYLHPVQSGRPFPKKATFLGLFGIRYSPVGAHSCCAIFHVADT